MTMISASVGNNGVNLENDVRTVQTLLNKNLAYLRPNLALKVDGYCGPVTTGMILEFQRRRVGLAKPDGCVEPKGKTFSMLMETKDRDMGLKGGYDNLLLVVQQFLETAGHTLREAMYRSTRQALVDGDFRNAANTLSVEVAAIKAVSAVESNGSGFFPSGKPAILFEGHKFSEFTNKKFDKSHPSLSYPKWKNAYYIGGDGEYARYQAAKQLDSQAAMKATSWGKFQIMGFNHVKAGYSSVESFVQDMHKSESHHLRAFVSLIKASGWDAALRTKNWAEFARLYNGKDYAMNKYDVRLEQAYNAFSAKK